MKNNKCCSTTNKLKICSGAGVNRERRIRRRDAWHSAGREGGCEKIKRRQRSRAEVPCRGVPHDIAAARESGADARPGRQQQEHLSGHRVHEQRQSGRLSQVQGQTARHQKGPDQLCLVSLILSFLARLF
jgi:hypothetical protein